MNLQIVPSIIAKNQSELNRRIKKVTGLSKTLHLDVMDGIFVKNTSLLFDFKLPKNIKFQAHLMVDNPLEWVEKNYSKIDSIVIHRESFKSVKDLKKSIKFVKRKKKSIGIAINPNTSLRKIYRILPYVDFVLIMTVLPGRYGSKFLPSTLKKISKLRHKNPSIKIGIDGGVSDKTANNFKEFQIDFFVIGSYFQKNRKPANALKSFQKLLKSTD